MSTIVGEVKYIIPKLYQSYRWFVVLKVVTRTAGRSIRSYNRSCLVPLELSVLIATKLKNGR